MLDLDTQAVTGWLQAIQPARSDSDWPPPIRAIESTGSAPDLFHELSQVIGRHQADDGHHLAAALSDPAAVALLRSVLAQLGAARMLRIVSALSDLLPDGETTAGLHQQLRDRRTPDGRALASALDATARTTLRGRLTADERLEALREALEQAEGYSMTRSTMAFLAYCALSVLAGTTPTLAQTLVTGSTGCAVISQAAADGANNRIQADSKVILQPTSVHALTCLDNILNGVGLDVITNILNPMTLLNAIKGQICSAITSTWASMTSGASCGLTITGFNLGIGGLGGGLSCPRLSFGGGGPPLATFGLGAGGAYGTGGGLYINGTGLNPTGYTLPTVPVGSF